MKSILWKLNILNPATNEVLSTEKFNSLREISEKYKNIPFNTWRNISIGRSKVYEKFLYLKKDINNLADIQEVCEEDKLYNKQNH
tara:strand:- start:973 stop:1227 length:255 start_codon:yes stop_codon:yes gene_type:complete